MLLLEKYNTIWGKTSANINKNMAIINQTETSW